MRVVVQRVSEASVDVINELGTLDPTFEPQQIGPGFMILVGVTDEDGDQQIAWLTHKILNLRIFEDEQGKMNRSIQDIGGEILSISQFTLFADVHKGNRPSWAFMASARAPMMGGKMAPPIRPMSIRPEISFWRSGRYIRVRERESENTLELPKPTRATATQNKATGGLEVIEQKMAKHTAEAVMMMPHTRMRTWLEIFESTIPPVNQPIIRAMK